MVGVVTRDAAQVDVTLDEVNKMRCVFQSL